MATWTGAASSTRRSASRAAFATLDQAKTRQDFLASAAWLRARADTNGRMSAVGFCYGGGIVHWLATELPDLNAAIPFYGNTPAPELAAKVRRGRQQAWTRTIAFLKQNLA